MSLAVALPKVVGVRHRRARVAIASLAALLLLLLLLSAGTGAVAIAPDQIVAIIASQIGLELPVAFTSSQQNVLLAIRIPRVLLAVLVGGSLAISGAAIQGLFRNPLADPSLIGVSSGSALAAVATIVLGSTIFGSVGGLLGSFMLPVAAFVGGAATTLLVYRIAARGRHVVVATMLLAGIAINALAGALTGVFTFAASDAQLRSITFWGLGSLGGATWESLGAASPFVVAALVIVPLLARPLDLLLLGEAEARQLGVSIERTKRLVVVATSLAVGASVAVAGVIGFVGLVAPHLLRLAIGPAHRWLLPGSALLGAVLLLAADLVARIIVAPAELPIGIVTAAIGAPVFLWFLLRDRSEPHLH